MKKYFLLPAFFTLCLGAATQSAFAQAPPSGGPQPGGNPVNPNVTPIDGGASLLLASGVAYGLKRLRQRRTK